MSTARWEFTVFGDPKGQPRARAFARNMGGGKFVARVFDAGTAEGWKSQIALAANEAGLAGAMIQGPVRLVMACHFARPKAHFRTGKNSSLLRDTAPRLHVAKPDLDNIIKAAKDALSHLGAWKDDCQVCDSRSTKRYVAAGERAFTVFEVTKILEGLTS